MGLLNFLLEFVGEEDKDKMINEKLFDEEARALGLSEFEKNDAKKSGLSPEEWLEENEPEYYKGLDK